MSRPLLLEVICICRCLSYTLKIAKTPCVCSSACKNYTDVHLHHISRNFVAPPVSSHGIQQHHTSITAIHILWLSRLFLTLLDSHAINDVIFTCNVNTKKCLTVQGEFIVCTQLIYKAKSNTKNMIFLPPRIIV